FFFLRRLLPLEVDLPAVPRPAHLRRFIAHQARAAHDVVDGQSEAVRGLRLQEKERQSEGGDEFTHSAKRIAQARPQSRCPAAIMNLGPSPCRESWLQFFFFFSSLRSPLMPRPPRK